MNNFQKPQSEQNPILLELSKVMGGIASSREDTSGLEKTLSTRDSNQRLQMQPWHRVSQNRGRKDAHFGHD